MEVLIRVPQLDILDKDEFVAEDRQEALAAWDERRDELQQEDAAATRLQVRAQPTPRCQSCPVDCAHISLVGAPPQTPLPKLSLSAPQKS